jgi:hypothetical protein
MDIEDDAEFLRGLGDVTSSLTKRSSHEETMFELAESFCSEVLGEEGEEDQDIRSTGRYCYVYLSDVETQIQIATFWLYNNGIGCRLAPDAEEFKDSIKDWLIVNNFEAMSDNFEYYVLPLTPDKE